MIRIRGVMYRDADEAHDVREQEKLDAEQEAQAKRNASGTSPEVLSLQQAFSEGQKAGMLGLTAGLNPYDHSTPESAEWERARAAIIAARLSQSLRRNAA